MAIKKTVLTILLLGGLSSNLMAVEMFKYASITVSSGTLMSDLEDATGLKFHVEAKNQNPDAAMQYGEVSGSLLLIVFGNISQSVRDIIDSVVDGHRKK